jgi:enolase
VQQKGEPTEHRLLGHALLTRELVAEAPRSRLGMRRVMSVSIALASAAALALGLAASALAGGSSITLHGPHANVYGTSFHYTASGRASGSAD